MRAVVGIPYWVLVGFLALNALYVSVAENRLWSGSSIPVALALFGAWWLGLGYSGAGLVVVGAYPALLITRAVLLQTFSSDRSCSTVAFDGRAPFSDGLRRGLLRSSAQGRRSGSFGVRPALFVL